MSNPTVRISPRAHRTLKELATRSGQPMQSILDQAIETERRRRFLEDANASYARVQQDPSAWAEMEADRASLEGTLQDGLDADETWSEAVLHQGARQPADSR